MAFTAVIPDEGVVTYANIIMSQLGGGGLGSLIHLYVNNYTPARNTVLADFVDAVAGGMLPQALGLPVNNGVDPSGRDIWSYPQSVWTASGGGLPEAYYGYFVDCVDPITHTRRVIQAQRFVSQPVVIAIGNQVKFQLSFGANQC